MAANSKRNSVSDDDQPLSSDYDDDQPSSSDYVWPAYIPRHAVETAYKEGLLKHSHPGVTLLNIARDNAVHVDDMLAISEKIFGVSYQKSCAGGMEAKRVKNFELWYKQERKRIEDYEPAAAESWRRGRVKKPRITAPTKVAVGFPSAAEEQEVAKEQEVALPDIPGLEDTLAGRDENRPEDVVISNVNVSRLCRLVLSDILLDQQQPSGERVFDPKDPLTTVTLKQGLLIRRNLPWAYEPYVSLEEWAALYKHVAGKESLWDKVAAIPSPDVQQVVHDLEMAKLNEELDGEIQNVDTKMLDSEEQLVVRSLFPHLDVSPPEPESEPSYTAKYVVPHFNRLKGKRWTVHYDTTMLERKRPDITISAFGRPLLVGELKSPHATSAKRKLQVAEGLSRALGQLKADARKYNWDNVVPSIYTCISPDGLHFQIFKVEMHAPITLFIPLGKVPIVTSLETLPLLGRCLIGFRHLRDILLDHAECIKAQRRRHSFQPPQVLPATPTAKGLLRQLRVVFPDAISPEKMRAKPKLEKIG
ncbi:hypothetical protein HDU85_005810 [Gaertneriomyces sp. JEL0708]|nr:hypothetical protein HDU85_005810 [Gaertneriomyces sp. JEL0708]